jgi:hypothetical protein
MHTTRWATYRPLYTIWRRTSLRPESRLRVVLLLAATFCTCGAGTAVALGHEQIPARTTSQLFAPLAVAPLTNPSPVASPANPLRRHRVSARHQRIRHRSAAQRRPAVVRLASPSGPAGPTNWHALNAAIARIPSYVAGRSLWVVSDRYGHWGTADWYHDTLYISPRVPPDRLYDVAVHEWSHELSVLDYAGDVGAAVSAMNNAFGASGSDGLVGAERAADCMAILQGATWTHYTPCTSVSWRQLASRLLHGKPL